MSYRFGLLILAFATVHQETKTRVIALKSRSGKTSIYCEISIGELIDKITILQIKAEKIKDAQKLGHVKSELASLQNTLNENIQTTPALEKLTNQLKEINAKLWVIEDAIRDKERQKRFDAEFIELARAVYFTNDERARIKREINDLLGSHIIEEKDYASYRYLV